ncbi:MAG: acetate--CoA ligase family protein, partial [Burkholderiales bacterium]
MDQQPAEQQRVVALRRQQILNGPNLIAPVPVIRLELALRDAERAQRAPESSRARLLAQGPTLASLQAAATIADLVAQVALALQRAFGDDVRLATPAARSGRDRIELAHEYREGVLGLLAGRVAVSLVDAALVEPPEPDTVPTRLAQLHAQLVGQMRQRALSVLGRRISWEAQRRGIPCSRLHPNQRFIRLGQGRKSRRFLGSYSDATGYLPTMLATSKRTAADVLRAHGFPVPRQALAVDADEAVAAAASIGYPVVVKPERADRGLGVSIDLADEPAVRAAFAEANRFGPVLVEEQVTGEDHRVTVIQDRMVAAGRDIAARVTGDGRSTVRELIDALNEDPRRSELDFSPLKPVRPDDDILRTLASQGLALEDVPGAGQLVRLRTWWIPASDHTAEDLTDRIHPANRAMIERAVRLIGLDVAGVDFITPDISRPWREVGGAITEINPTPGLNTHGRAGAPDILRLLLEAFFPPGDDGRVPIAILIDGPGQDAAARVALRAAAVLQAAGPAVGAATARGVLVGGIDAAPGDHAGMRGARMVLDDPLTEAAVL